MRGPCIFSFITLIGTVSISEDGEGRITGVYLPNSNLPAMDDHETDALSEAAAQLEEYFSGKRREFDLELSYEGSGFRMAVLDSIRRIPYGEVRTYGDIAKDAGSPNAYRAVGTVCSENLIPIIIPCHRVVAAGGGIGGFGGGLDKKRILLRTEGITAYE